MKLYYLDRPGGSYYSSSFAVVAPSADAAAQLVNEHFKAKRSSAEVIQNGCASDYEAVWSASDFSCIEVGGVVEL